MPGSISLCERHILNQASITLKNIVDVDSSIIKGRDHIHMFRPKDHLARYLHDIIAWCIIVGVLNLGFHFLWKNRILRQRLFFILLCIF